MNEIRSMDANSIARPKGVQIAHKNTVVSAAVTSFVDAEKARFLDSVRKNRASPTKEPKTIGEFRSPNREFVRVATASRLMAFNFHQTQTNIKGSSVFGCGRWKNYGSDKNTAEIEVSNGIPRMLGHFQCKNVWSCEHCAKARVAQTRSWIRAELMPALDAKDLTGSLVTLTLSHTYGEDWGDTVQRLLDAFKRADKALIRPYKAAGSIGKLKTLEVTVGVNGIHAHIHKLLIHKKDADLPELEEQMMDAWNKAVIDVGGKTNEFGFDFKPNCVNTYVAKLETAHELASHGTKEARKKGKTLAQLLDAAAAGSMKAGEEWLRAQNALGGKMRFHAGALPKKLGIVCPSSWEDEERAEKLAKEKEDQPDPIRITYAQTAHLKATGSVTNRAGLAIILRSARGADAAKVLRTVEALCADVDRVQNTQSTFKKYSDNIDSAVQVLQAAHERPLTREEVEIYLHQKSKKLLN